MFKSFILYIVWILFYEVIHRCIKYLKPNNTEDLPKILGTGKQGHLFPRTKRTNVSKLSEQRQFCETATIGNQDFDFGERFISGERMNRHPREGLSNVDHKMLWTKVTSYYYRNFPKFSDRQVWANSADPDQTDQGLYCLQFPLHLLDELL